MFQNNNKEKVFIKNKKLLYTNKNNLNEKFYKFNKKKNVIKLRADRLIITFYVLVTDLL